MTKRQIKTRERIAAIFAIAALTVFIVGIDLNATHPFSGFLSLVVGGGGICGIMIVFFGGRGEDY